LHNQPGARPVDDRSKARATSGAKHTDSSPIYA
jgi:hypothetical protein